MHIECTRALGFAKTEKNKPRKTYNFHAPRGKAPAFVGGTPKGSFKAILKCNFHLGGLISFWVKQICKTLIISFNS